MVLHLVQQRGITGWVFGGIIVRSGQVLLLIKSSLLVALSLRCYTDALQVLQCLTKNWRSRQKARAESQATIETGNDNRLDQSQLEREDGVGGVKKNAFNLRNLGASSVSLGFEGHPCLSGSLLFLGQHAASLHSIVLRIHGSHRVQSRVGGGEVVEPIARARLDSKKAFIFDKIQVLVPAAVICPPRGYGACMCAKNPPSSLPPCVRM